MHALFRLATGITLIWLLLLAFQFAWSYRRRINYSSKEHDWNGIKTGSSSSSSSSSRDRIKNWTTSRDQPDTSGGDYVPGWALHLKPFYFLASYTTISRRILKPIARQSEDYSSSAGTGILHRFAINFYATGGLVVLVCFTVLLPLYGLMSPLLYLYQSISHVDPLSVLRSSTGSQSSFSTTIFQDDMPPGLVIPGITVPIRDALATFIAGALAIAWHEAGHGFCAVWNDVDITSVAFFLIYAFPGAYVALDSSSFDALSSAASKLSIIAAGVWHNLILCLAITVLLKMGIVTRNSAVYSWLGWNDLNEHGVVVQLVDKSSPLSNLLASGQLVTALDDLELHDSVVYKHWDHYLAQAETSTDSSVTRATYDSLGWCLDKETYEAHSNACCAAEQTSTSDSGQVTVADTNTKVNERQICFVPTTPSPNDGARTGHCIDPAEVLPNQRCTDTCAQASQTCVYPDPSSRLLRLTVRDLQLGRQETVFFRGPPIRVWKDVKVGRYLAPVSWLQALPVDIEAFWRYTYGTSLGLAMFNLLPLPKLDGDELLTCILDARSSGAPLLPTAASRKSLQNYQQGRTNDCNSLIHSLLAPALSRISSVLSRLLRLDYSSARRKMMVRRSIQIASVVLIVVNVGLSAM